MKLRNFQKYIETRLTKNEILDIEQQVLKECLDSDHVPNKKTV